VALLIGVVVMSLTAQENMGYLKVNANPGRTGVFIDGKYVGPAKSWGRIRSYAVTPGQHQIKLLEPRYEDFTTTVQIQAGMTQTIVQEMTPRELIKPPYGTLRIKGFDKYAAVYVNDRFVGHADEFNNFAQGLLLNPGQYTVRVEPVGGGSPVSQNITIEADKTTFVSM
jgi:hypothetical protein